MEVRLEQSEQGIGASFHEQTKRILPRAVFTITVGVGHFSVDKRAEMETGRAREVQPRRWSVGKIAILLFRIVGREETCEQHDRVQRGQKEN